MALEIFWGSGSPYSWRVLLGAEIKHLDYTSTLLDFSTGDMKTPGFRALNPRGNVPVIRDGEFVLYESLAILEYLDTKSSAHRLFGEQPREAALIRRVIAEFENYLREPLFRTAAGLFGAPQGEGEDLERSAQRALHELATLERIVTDRPWLAGERPSAADAVAFPFIQLLKRGAAKAEARAKALGLLHWLGASPHLERWVQRVEALPGYERTYPPHWRTAPSP